MPYRNLTDAETRMLEAQGCTAEKWASIRALDPFSPALIRNTHFAGDVWLGNGATLRDIRRIANYVVGGNALISNVGEIAVEGETAFGNGVEISPWNESGSRAFPIYERLTAQIAWIMAARRSSEECLRNLRALIRKFTDAKRSRSTSIGEGARIENCGSIINVSFGPAVRVSGALELRNGTIASRADAPAHIGPGVIARDFILCAGSSITDGAQANHCFIGQGVRIGKAFSAEHCAFFANSEALNGEACSHFAGPHTVTHHKSTLLIAAMTSFFNAGSGANQSNHAYKLGPLHQGTLLRGAKLASGAHLLWPAIAGPYSTVSGKHHSHFDLADMPFTLIKEINGQTIALPAHALASCGLHRDAAKWPARDNRPENDRLDLIHYDLLGPYAIQKVLHSLDTLRRLKEQPHVPGETITLNGTHIPADALDKGIRHYEMALDIFLGDCLAALLEQHAGLDGARAKLAELASDTPTAPLPAWVDAAGMFARADQMDALVREIAAGKFAYIEEVRNSLGNIADAYEDLKMRWFAALLETRENIRPGELTADTAQKILTAWKHARLRWNELLQRDAAREFAPAMRAGYGLDAEENQRDKDFETARGTLEDTPFATALQQETKATSDRADHLIAALPEK